MIPYGEHIQNLLSRNDCVTVPGIGGFIVQPVASRIEAETGRIYPPGRTASFNQALQHDDGLLTASVASAENISYSDASSRLARFAGNCKLNLALGRPVVFEGVGELRQDRHGSVRFYPHPSPGLDEEFFGMEPVALVSGKAAGNHLRNRPVRSDRRHRENKAAGTRSVRWTLAVTLPVMVFLLYGIIFPVQIKPVIADFSGFISGIPALVREAINHDNTTSGNPATPPALSVPAAPPPVMDTEVILPPGDADAPETIMAPVKQGPRFYIIGGCFEHAENAANFKELLTRRGFVAEEAGTNRLGHIRISYRSFDDRAAALDYLQKIRDTENPSAWLLRF